MEEDPAGFLLDTRHAIPLDSTRGQWCRAAVLETEPTRQQHCFFKNSALIQSHINEIRPAVLASFALPHFVMIFTGNLCPQESTLGTVQDSGTGCSCSPFTCSQESQS